MKKNLRGDLFGGLTAGIVALPLALAFGEQSGLGATAGLYGAAFIAFFAAMKSSCIIPTIKFLTKYAHEPNPIMTIVISGNTM